MGFWAAPGNRARVIVDERGIEWEVYDESEWSIEMALEWDFQPQTENPGRIFASVAGRKRIWPCPPGWRDLGDGQLVRLLTSAKTIL